LTNTAYMISILMTPRMSSAYHVYFDMKRDDDDDDDNNNND